MVQSVHVDIHSYCTAQTLLLFFLYPLVFAAGMPLQQGIHVWCQTTLH
ncbi:hypothetical protein Poly41_58730 [Novipirellula artificiosorum]|uniref:Uncharacterized protein n=1 Tax=Novipirellula artificiosorum TaxID=2528016 RepID=A0A5C6D7F7_9BACT|nr:hypothetical protein Poly41_58730 [Novipirellula artificiosorum]